MKRLHIVIALSVLALTVTTGAWQTPSGADRLTAEVFEGFEGAIRERESRGEKVESNLVGINKADIIESDVKKNTAYVTVKFVSELISVTRDAEGDVVEGDPKKVREVTDIWTFARDISSKNPNWKLVATESAN